MSWKKVEAVSILPRLAVRIFSWLRHNRSTCYHGRAFAVTAVHGAPGNRERGSRGHRISPPRPARAQPRTARPRLGVPDVSALLEHRRTRAGVPGGRPRNRTDSPPHGPRLGTLGARHGECVPCPRGTRSRLAGLGGGRSRATDRDDADLARLLGDQRPADRFRDLGCRGRLACTGVRARLPGRRPVNAVFFHFLPTLLARRPSPGFFTALLLYLPIGIWAYIAAARDGVLGAATLIVSVILGAAAMAGVVVLLVLQRRFRYPDSPPDRGAASPGGSAAQ